ncbi:hypothetical protein ACX83H_31980 [Burkholderia pseudomallei]|uniref:hypothetical protein n=1 Tax=Burkholderia TaxID=32008 RepID=UPI0011C4D0A8|nr:MULTISPECIES: hypothetical protein [Burkholderia]MCV9916670.1 hypothetical protein [Burkholderia pseudomallei]MCV9973810.1 hypothetical protein [Burkholderia pseudomallei]MCW0072641.1 hypothetical protein [Burkholderia pseudomallei]
MIRRIGEDPWADLRRLLDGADVGGLSSGETDIAVARNTAAITPANRHVEVSFGKTVGRETWPPFDESDSGAAHTDQESA